MIDVTDLAIQKMKEMIEARNDPDTKGIRIGVNSKGCSGHSYTFEYTNIVYSTDFVFEKGGVTLVIDLKSQFYIVGSTIDYEETQFASGFKFINPQVTSECGCGKSFSI